MRIKIFLPKEAWLSLALAATLIACALFAIPTNARAEQEAEFAVLVFTKTAGYRHRSISAGIAALKTLGERNGFRVDATESAAVFTAENLQRYRVIVLLNTTGDVLNAAEQKAFEGFIRRGGGFVGIHSAADTEHDWPWYGRLVGAYFQSHPAIQRASLLVDRGYVATAHLPVQWPRTDEWYNFKDDPSQQVNVLMRIDERSYYGGRMGTSHPMAWHHEFDGGRAWYTALGHTEESYAEPDFLQHVLGGIRWAAGVTPE